MKKKLLFSLIALCVFALLLLILLLGFRKQKEPAGEIEAFFHLYFSPAEETLISLLEDFESRYPDIQVSYHIQPYQDMKNSLSSGVERITEDPGGIILTVLTGADLGGDNNGETGFYPWISDTWGLFYSRSRLEEAGYSRSELMESAAGGLDTFITELAGVCSEDEYLFYTGASYSWPWLAWIQHLELEASRGQVPAGFTSGDYSRGIGKWNKLVADGLVNPDFADTGLAASLYSIRGGEGLFVLSDSSIYGAYLPDERSEIEYIPFPGSVEQGWQVGGSFYLGLIYGENTPDEVVRAGALLNEYLRSGEIRERFLQKTGILLLPETTPGDLNEVPSLTQKVRDPELRELLEYIRRPVPE